MHYLDVVVGGLLILGFIKGFTSGFEVFAQVNRYCGRRSSRGCLRRPL